MNTQPFNKNIPTRYINEIIIHCSATMPTHYVDCQIIDKWHKERGFKKIGYHYVILLDGTIENGRQTWEVGAHCSGHNAHSVGICYTGGIDTLTGKSKDTRTQEQKNAITKLIVMLCAIYDIQEIVGHNEYAPKDCPCFNAREEYYHLLP
jgi:N-acetylmuramoyl-L-alanine amidase.